jgi:Glutathione S-transferase, C-terminal domain
MQLYDLGPGAAAESRARLETELDWLDGKLADGRAYLAGDRFSRADLTVASLLANFARPKELALLDRDIFSVDPYTIGDTKVLATYLNGRLVYAAPANDRAEGRENEIGDWWGQREARMRDWLHRD